MFQLAKGLPMSLINLDDIKPGMVTASEVKDPRGRIILGTGQELTEKHLRIFKMWGIVEADIEGLEKSDIANQAASDIDPQALTAIEEKVELMFKHTNNDHEFIKELRRLTILRFIRNHMNTNERGN